jgi:hypothetical protein
MGLKQTYLKIVGLCFAWAAGSAAHATIACQIVVDPKGVGVAPLFVDAVETAEVIRNLPADDLVFYVDEDLAPRKVEDWFWVRHDVTQEDIWQSGEFGWVRSENIGDCG